MHLPSIGRAALLWLWLAWVPCGAATNGVAIGGFAADGTLSWSNHPLASQYRVEWASSPTGAWQASWRPLDALPATSGQYQVRVPLLYRISAFVPDVGVDYHAYGTNFLQTCFITTYHQPGVRATVQGQLQGMADRGATRISTRLWMVTEPGTGNFGETWRATFPITDQEQTNLRTYAQDVAAVTGSFGNRLRLDLGFLWLGASDYTAGSPASGLGTTPISATTYVARVAATTDRVLAAIAGVNRPDGVPVVDVIYLNGEVMVGAKANEGWFLTNTYPRFVTTVSQAGFKPSVYFIVNDTQQNVLQTNYVDATYSILNNRRSMYWMYRSLRFMVDQGLPVPHRIDFSYYVPSSGADYGTLLTRVLDDADAVLPSLGAPRTYGLAETYYFADGAQRRAFGQAIAAETSVRTRLQAVTFWTTPDGGGPGAHAAYPFAIEDYRPAVNP